MNIGLDIDELTSLSWSDVSPTSVIYSEVSQTTPVRYMWEEHPQVAAFLYYAGLGAFDPKMPAELRLFGPGYVAANVFGVGAILWYLDPKDKREGGLLQSDWYDRNVRQPWDQKEERWDRLVYSGFS